LQVTLRRMSDCGNVNLGGEEICWIVRDSISSCQIIELLNSDGDGPVSGSAASCAKVSKSSRMIQASSNDLPFEWTF
jgi:hypothetical protein